MNDNDELFIECWSRTTGPDRLIGHAMIYLPDFIAEVAADVGVRLGEELKAADAGQAEHQSPKSRGNTSVERSIVVRQAPQTRHCVSQHTPH